MLLSSTILDAIGIKGGLAIAASLACVTLFFLNKDARGDLREVRADLAVAEATIETHTRTIELFEQAARERLRDEEELDEQEEELNDALAIDDPDERRRAFVCAVLRSQSETTGRAVPAECRPRGS